MDMASIGSHLYHPFSIRPGPGDELCLIWGNFHSLEWFFSGFYTKQILISRESGKPSSFLTPVKRNRSLSYLYIFILVVYIYFYGFFTDVLTKNTLIGKLSSKRLHEIIHWSPDRSVQWLLLEGIWHRRKQNENKMYIDILWCVWVINHHFSHILYLIYIYI